MKYFGPIYSMSDSRKDMFFFLRKNSEERILHLLLMVYFRGSSSYDHWRGESFGFLPHTISTFKGSKRYPRLDFIEQNLFLHCIDSDGVRRLFVDRVSKKGLSLPGDFQNTYWESVALVGRVLHEVSLVLYEKHSILSEEYYGILDRFGL